VDPAIEVVDIFPGLCAGGVIVSLVGISVLSTCSIIGSRDFDDYLFGMAD
jgi:hypothetical protein